MDASAKTLVALKTNCAAKALQPFDVLHAATDSVQKEIGPEAGCASRPTLKNLDCLFLRHPCARRLGVVLGHELAVLGRAVFLVARTVIDLRVQVYPNH